MQKNIVLPVQNNKMEFSKRSSYVRKVAKLSQFQCLVKSKTALPGKRNSNRKTKNFRPFNKKVNYQKDTFKKFLLLFKRASVAPIIIKEGKFCTDCYQESELSFSQL